MSSSAEEMSTSDVNAKQEVSNSNNDPVPQEYQQPVDESQSKESVPNDTKPNPARALIFDNVVHHRQESVFTKYSADLELDGFKNFIYLILIISCGRLMFENISFYGFKANPLRWLDYVLTSPLSRPTFFLFLLIHPFIVAALILERCYVSFLYGNQRAGRLADGTSSFETTEVAERAFRFIYLLNLFSMLCLPVLINCTFECNPFILSFICLLYSATALKLYSYHQVNSWWRTGKIYGRTPDKLSNKGRLENKMESYAQNILSASDGDNPTLLYYPQNLSLSNIFYYFYAPTLCYQLNFPRKKTIDYYFVARCLFEYVFLTELVTVLFEQWVIVPLDQRHFVLSELTLREFLFRWTKMSLGTISIWLIGFYSMFQSLSNLIAEVLRFADREFYGDWWNAKTISEFWRNWNLPVHRWCVRHLYKPMVIEGGYSRTAASFAIFFISGLFHEYLFSVPLGMVCVHFIMGMTMQMVLELATAHIHKTNARLANAIVWLSLILGQSMLILLYYNDIILRMRSRAAVAVAANIKVHT